MLRPERPCTPADLVEQQPRHTAAPMGTAHVQEHQLEPVRRTREPLAAEHRRSDELAAVERAEQDAAVPERLRETGDGICEVGRVPGRDLELAGDEPEHAVLGDVDACGVLRAVDLADAADLGRGQLAHDHQVASTASELPARRQRSTPATSTSRHQTVALPRHQTQ